MLCEKCRDALPEIKTCFVVSPIGAPGSEARITADLLLEDIIKPACAAYEILPVRADSVFSRNAITDTIVEKLESSDPVIADITGNNPNVFFEIGYRFALGLPLILITASLDALPFDIRVMPVIVYDMRTVGDRKRSICAIQHRIEGYLSGEIKTNRVLREEDLATEDDMDARFF
jgi:hypothetical protein